MFLDSLVSDSAWRAVYARNDNDEPIPFEALEQEIQSAHPFSVLMLRGMLAVSYFEKALYELPEEEVTAEKVKELADKVEVDIQGGLGLRPILAVSFSTAPIYFRNVFFLYAGLLSHCAHHPKYYYLKKYPHIISDEASCYYHGYTLAEMSVHQTRHFFKERDGYIVNNPKVGPTLTEAYWSCGNSRAFLDIVRGLTGKELSGTAWVEALQETVEDKIKREKQEYDEALAKASSLRKRKLEGTGTKAETVSLDNTLDMTIRFVDGDTLIADSSKLRGGILEACTAFEKFVASKP